MKSPVHCGNPKDDRQTIDTCIPVVHSLFFSLIDILSGGIFSFSIIIAEKKVSKSLVFLIEVRGPLFFYIFFFNDTLFAPLDFYSDFYSLITGLIWCMSSLNYKHHTDG